MNKEFIVFCIAMAALMFGVGAFMGLLQQGALVNEMGGRLKTVFMFSFFGAILVFVGAVIAMTGYIIASYFVSK